MNHFILNFLHYCTDTRIDLNIFAGILISFFDLLFIFFSLTSACALTKFMMMMLTMPMSLICYFSI